MLTFVESHQPYKRGEETGDDPLVGLHELWNTDKHRILNASPIYVVPNIPWRDLFHVDPDIEPVEFRWLVDPDRELKTETKLALLRFPSTIPLPRVVMDGELPVQIGIGNGKGEAVRLQESLDLIRAIVADAKTLLSGL